MCISLPLWPKYLILSCFANVPQHHSVVQKKNPILTFSVIPCSLLRSRFLSIFHSAPGIQRRKNPKCPICSTKCMNLLPVSLLTLVFFAALPLLPQQQHTLFFFFFTMYSTNNSVYHTSSHLHRIRSTLLRTTPLLLLFFCLCWLSTYLPRLASWLSILFSAVYIITTHKLQIVPEVKI